MCMCMCVRLCGVRDGQNVNVLCAAIRKETRIRNKLGLLLLLHIQSGKKLLQVFIVPLVKTRACMCICVCVCGSMCVSFLLVDTRYWTLVWIALLTQ